MKVLKIGKLLMITYFLISMSTVFLANSTLGEGDHTRQIQGRTEISDGLPNKNSYTTVEVFDVDGNGQDELYLGGAGRGSSKAAGIHAFEYDKGLGKWNKFGHGLPDKGSGKYY